jgi:hypothetical protein
MVMREGMRAEHGGVFSAAAMSCTTSSALGGRCRDKKQGKVVGCV